MVMRKCALCGWHRRIRPTGGLARQRGDHLEAAFVPDQLGHLDPASEPFIDFRSAAGGRGKGFSRIEALSLLQALQDPEYRMEAEAVVSWARLLIQAVDNLKT